MLNIHSSKIVKKITIKGTNNIKSINFLSSLKLSQKKFFTFIIFVQLFLIK